MAMRKLRRNNLLLLPNLIEDIGIAERANLDQLLLEKAVESFLIRLVQWVKSGRAYRRSPVSIEEHVRHAVRYPPTPNILDRRIMLSIVPPAI